MKYIPGADYFVYWVKFPENNGTNGGAVTPNDDGTFSIFMDEKLLGREGQARKTYKHEVDHIENDDFYNGRPLHEIEQI